MSILKVDTINEKTTGNGIEIAHALKGSGMAGHVIQYSQTETNVATTISAGANANILTINFTPKFSNSLIHVSSTLFNVRKTTGAGTSTWMNARIFLDGVQQGNINGTFGYPETFNDHRYTFTITGKLTAWSGAKAVALNCYVGSTGSNWVVSYQGATTNLSIMEIAQ